MLRSTMVIFFIFHSLRKQQKVAFTQYAMLCVVRKNLINFGAYVGFFPVK